MLFSLGLTRLSRTGRTSHGNASPLVVHDLYQALCQNGGFPCPVLFLETLPGNAVNRGCEPLAMLARFLTIQPRRCVQKSGVTTASTHLGESLRQSASVGSNGNYTSAVLFECISQLRFLVSFVFDPSERPGPRTWRRQKWNGEVLEKNF